MLRVPEDVWQQMLRVFAEIAEDVEQVAFLDGYEHGEERIVTTLVLPESTCAPGFYSVDSDAMHRAAVHLRQHSMVRLAQVHTHPGSWVGLSERDKECAYSQRDGAISIVLPHWGRGGTESIGVYQRSATGWQSVEAERAMVITPSLRDLRSEPCSRCTRDTKGSSADFSSRSARILSMFTSSWTRFTRKT